MRTWIGLGSKGWLALLLAASLALVACGDDSDDGGDGDGDGDGDMTMGDGDMTMGDGDMTMGDGDSAAPTSIPCGSSSCMNLGAGLGAGLPIMLPEACCFDEAAGICGTVMNGACAEPPQNDDRCPPLVTGFGFDGVSCCIEASNECGLIDTITGSGACTSLTAVNEMLGALPIPIPIPDPVTCDGQPIGGDTGDGGAGDDAGL